MLDGPAQIRGGVHHVRGDDHVESTGGDTLRHRIGLEIERLGAKERIGRESLGGAGRERGRDVREDVLAGCLREGGEHRGGRPAGTAADLEDPDRASLREPLPRSQHRLAHQGAHRGHHRRLVIEPLGQLEGAVGEQERERIARAPQHVGQAGTAATEESELGRVAGAARDLALETGGVEAPRLPRHHPPIRRPAQHAFFLEDLEQAREQAPVAGRDAGRGDQRVETQRAALREIAAEGREGLLDVGDAQPIEIAQRLGIAGRAWARRASARPPSRRGPPRCRRSAARPARPPAATAPGTATRPPGRDGLAARPRSVRLSRRPVISATRRPLSSRTCRSALMVSPGADVRRTRLHRRGPGRWSRRKRSSAIGR